MLRGVGTGRDHLDCFDLGQSLRALLCLTLDGAYEGEWECALVRCGPAALLSHPPGQVYGARISSVGSRCLTVDIDPVVFRSAEDAIPALRRLHASRRAPSSWLAFELRRELELAQLPRH